MHPYLPWLNILGFMKAQQKTGQKKAVWLISQFGHNKNSFSCITKISLLHSKHTVDYLFQVDFMIACSGYGTILFCLVYFFSGL